MRQYCNIFFACGIEADEYISMDAKQLLDSIDSSGIDLKGDPDKCDDRPWHGSDDFIEVVEYNKELYIISKHFGYPYVGVERIHESGGAASVNKKNNV
jgi:hypothetical protein